MYYDDGSINTEKYSGITSEIERFIEVKKEEPKNIKGNVEDVDLSNNVLKIRLQEIKKMNLSIGSPVLLYSGLLGVEIRAVVKDLYGSIIKLEIKNDPSQFENKKVTIDTNKTNVILGRLEKVVENIKKGKISLDNERILDFIIGKNKPKYSDKRVGFISKRLNENQKEAVKNSIRAEDFHLIIGPPGTGKTYVIEELIKQFSKRKQKVLITAWTNLAVDNIVKRLPKEETKKLVRIGPIGEVDLQVKKYSIFEKMKRHKDWGEVERCNKIINGLFKLIPKVKGEMGSVQNDINETKHKVKSLEREISVLVNEMGKYGDISSKSMNIPEIADISSINQKMISVSKKSDACLSLSKNILEINELENRIPKEDYIQNLKRDVRSMRFSIARKRIPSLFSRERGRELQKLRKAYEKSKNILDEILNLQREHNHLKALCNNQYEAIYQKGGGQPDKDTLDSELEIYKILQNEYLPSLKKQELANGKKKLFEINQEVSKLYVESLKNKISILNARINNLNTEMYIKINHKNELHGQYVNLLASLNLHKRNVNRLKKAIISEIINNAEIIVATAISSCHYFLDNTNFDVMIMDESSQVASFMSLLPLIKCKKFILVGDNKQLQPIEEENISKEMNLSIFNRLSEMHPNASTLLTVQYRMHKNIAKIANEIFYNGKLRTSDIVAERTINIKEGEHQFLNPKIPAMFVDTSKVEYYEDEVGSSCSNTKEAKYVAYIVSLFIKNKIKTKDIGVVTPYVKQKLLIKEFLKDIKIKGVEVNTVHKFQGREKDIIMMSFARSKKYSFPQYKLKFVENETLVNVAITRAKKKLILVGNSKTLCQSKLLDKVIMTFGKESKIIL